MFYSHQIVIPLKKGSFSIRKNIIKTKSFTGFGIWDYKFFQFFLLLFSVCPPNSRKSFIFYFNIFFTFFVVFPLGKVFCFWRFLCRKMSFGWSFFFVVVVDTFAITVELFKLSLPNIQYNRIKLVKWNLFNLFAVKE